MEFTIGVYVPARRMKDGFSKRLAYEVFDLKGIVDARKKAIQMIKKARLPQYCREDPYVFASIEKDDQKEYRMGITYFDDQFTWYVRKKIRTSYGWTDELVYKASLNDDGTIKKKL